jgi:hypothetical protein
MMLTETWHPDCPSILHIDDESIILMNLLVSVTLPWEYLVIRREVADRAEALAFNSGVSAARRAVAAERA